VRLQYKRLSNPGKAFEDLLANELLSSGFLLGCLSYPSLHAKGSGPHRAFVLTPDVHLVGRNLSGRSLVNVTSQLSVLRSIITYGIKTVATETVNFRHYSITKTETQTHRNCSTLRSGTYVRNLEFLRDSALVRVV